MRIAALRLVILASPFFIGCTSVQPVREGALYRSGQLSPSQLETAVHEHHIKTVVNLRGKQPDAKWYRDQRELLKDLNVKQVDLALDEHAPDEQQVADLLATFKEEDKPILVHSYWSRGSVGLASGLYRVGIEKEKPAVARKELAFWQTQYLPFIPGAVHDKYLAQWGAERRATEGMVAAKRRMDASLSDSGFDELERPTPERAVAEHSAAKRYPWAPERSWKEDSNVETTVMLGPPKAISEERMAERSERRRY